MEETPIIPGAQGPLRKQKPKLTALHVIGEEPAERWDRGDGKTVGAEHSRAGTRPGPGVCGRAAAREGKTCCLGKVAGFWGFVTSALCFLVGAAFVSSRAPRTCPKLAASGESRPDRHPDCVL